MFSRFVINCSVVLQFLSGTLILSQQNRQEREFVFARKLYDDGLYLLAAEQLAEFSRNFPNHQNADNGWLLSGKSYIQLSEFDRAFNAFKELEIGYPRSRLLSQARFLMGNCRSEVEDPSAAAELYKRVALFHSEDPLAPTSLLFAARAYAEAGKPETAISVLNDLIVNYADSEQSVDAYSEMITIYLRLGQFNDAISVADGILKVYGNDFKDAGVYLLRGKVFAAAGQIAAAESEYKKIINNPYKATTKSLAYQRLGKIDQRRHNYGSAVAYYEQSLGHSDTLASETLMSMGMALFSQTKYRRALESFRKVTTKNGEMRFECDLKIAACYIQLKQYPVAESRFRTLINDLKASHSSRSDSFFAVVYRNLVKTLMKQGKPLDAILAIKEYEGQNIQWPEKSRAYLKFTEAEILELELGRHQTAIRKYQEFIETYPRHLKSDDAALAIGRCYERLGEYRSALREYNTYLSDFPAGDRFEWGETRVALIKATINLDDSGFEELTRLLTKSSDSDSKVTNIDIASIFYNNRSFDNAIKSYKRALNNPSNDTTEVLHKLGLSYLGKSGKQQLDGGSGESSRDSAAVCFRFVEHKSTDPILRNEAALELATITLTKLTQAEKIRFLQQKLAIWEASGYPQINILKLELIRESYLTASDSAAYLNVVAYCDSLLTNGTTEQFIEEVEFHKAMASTRTEPDSISLSYLSGFLQKFPASHFTATVLLQRAELYKELGNYSGAQADLQQLEADFYYSDLSVKARRHRADISFQLGDFKSAVDGYHSLSDDFEHSFEQGNAPELDPAIYFRLGRSYQERQEVNKAVESYLAFIMAEQSSPLRYDAMINIAQIAIQQKSQQFAETYLNTVKEGADAPKQQNRARILLGDLFFEDNEFVKARENYIAAARTSDDETDRMYASARATQCLYRQKKITAGDAEAQAFEKEFNDSKQRAEFLLDKANAYVSDKNFKLAEKVFKKLRSDYKKSDWGAQGEFGLGKIYLITNHTEDALKILTEIPEKYPESEVTPLTYYNLGDFYYKSQQVENAILAFKQVLSHSKGEKQVENALLYLIQCYRDVGFWDQAISLTRDYLDKYPGSEQALRKKIDQAFFLMKLKEYDRAIELFSELLPQADTESEPEIQFYIAQSYNEMGNFQRATAEYLKVKYLTRPTKLPWHVTALFEAGRCLQRINQTEQARKIFERIVKERGVGSNFGRFAKQKLDEMDLSQK